MHVGGKAAGAHRLSGSKLASNSRLQILPGKELQQHKDLLEADRSKLWTGFSFRFVLGCHKAGHTSGADTEPRWSSAETRSCLGGDSTNVRTVSHVRAEE